MNLDRIVWLLRHMTPEFTKGKTIVEVGSLNSGIRKIIEGYGPKEYIGVDIFPGPGVDVIADVGEFGFSRILSRQRADVVICEEVIEHVWNWPRAISNMLWLACPGVLLITAPSPGFPFHRSPEDYWRFTESDFKQIFNYRVAAKAEIETTPMPGVAAAVSPWTDRWSDEENTEDLIRRPVYSMLKRRSYMVPWAGEVPQNPLVAPVEAAVRRSVGSWIDLVRR